MPGLLDITRQSKTVRLSGGQELELIGLSSREIAGLIKRFPELQGLLGRAAAPAAPAAAEDGRSLVDAYPEAIAAAVALSAVLAPSCGVNGRQEVGNGHADLRRPMMPTPDEEEAVACWSGVDQWLALAVVLELSLPPAIARPLVAALADPDATVAVNPGRDQDLRSLPASSS